MTALRLARVAALAAATAAATQPPCYAAINTAQAIETPCSTTILDYSDGGVRVVLRAFSPNVATEVEADVLLDPGAPFDEYVRGCADLVFSYFTGVNKLKANLTSALTAPFIVRPPVAGGRENWAGVMALAPSRWPAARAPPAPVAEGVTVRALGGVVIAAVPVALPAAPTEGDFRAAYAALGAHLARLPVPGQWVINASSPQSPSFSFYYTQRFSGPQFLIEASAEVYHTP